MATISPLLAVGVNAATSTVIAVPQGAVYTVQLFTTGNVRIPSGFCPVLVKTSTGNQPLSDKALSRYDNAVQLAGPGDYYVSRPAGMAVGIEQVT